ncbi:MAG: TMEM175 family protein [Halobacteriota archaeon]
MPTVPGVAGRDKRFWRLDTFSDAIFAVAMTLLVFSFPISNLPQNLAQAEVETLIRGLFPQFMTFVISFLVVGAFWLAHHTTFDSIQRYDRTVVWLNFLFLLFIVFIPFPTAVLVGYGQFWFAIAFYAGTLAAAGFTLALLWQYASLNYRLIDTATDPREIRLETFRSLVIPCIFLLSIGLAFIAPDLAQYSWLSIFFVEWGTKRRSKMITS